MRVRWAHGRVARAAGIQEALPGHAGIGTDWTQRELRHTFVSIRRYPVFRFAFND
jgi:hypothetical protein